MNLTGIKVIGGQIMITALNTKLQDKVFDIGKAHTWLGMIEQHERPTKWGKSSKKGTKIYYDAIFTKEDMERAFDELEIYIHSVNRKHGTDISLQRPKEEVV